MVSRIDPSRPGTIYALGWHVRQQLANAKADIEGLLPIAGGTLTGPITFADLGNDNPAIVTLGALNIAAHGFVWLQTDDGAPSGGIGGMSGNGVGGKSGDVWFGTGDTTGADSGMGGLQTGQATGGHSGNLNFVTGNSDQVSGDIALYVGNGPVHGNIVLHNYKTADPHVAGAVWADPAAAYALKVSQG